MTKGTPIGFPEPPTAFYFKVVVEGIPNSDQGFQEVSGIAPEPDVEELVEGGRNQFVHSLPKPANHSRLMLKRGVVPEGSPLLEWCRSVLESGLGAPITPKEIKLYLLDQNNEPLRGWSFVGVYPVKWDIAGLQGKSGNVAVESIELSYWASRPLE